MAQKPLALPFAGKRRLAVGFNPMGSNAPQEFVDADF
jgi:hypothetical protein